MNKKSEKFITFVIFMKSYKYRILFFELINDFANWQHYMNDFLFNFLNAFCQIYLNDIFIYNKFKKKQIVHVCTMLKKLKKIDLQMNIEKCEFFKKEIIFLNVILSMNDFRMNLKKNKNYNQLSTFYKFQENTNFCEFWQFLSTFHSRLFEKNLNCHSNDQEIREIWINCKNRKTI